MRILDLAQLFFEPPQWICRHRRSLLRISKYELESVCPVVPFQSLV